jgi:hypothetical protein
MILQEIDFMIDQVRKDEKSHLADIFDNLDKERRTLTIRPNACSVLCDFVQIAQLHVL